MGQSDECSSRWGLIFATIGAAIGTGNIWRFPYITGENGGGAGPPVDDEGPPAARPGAIN